ncbi:MAG TPA: hypothetical protein VFC00_20780 [Micromonosporaceae bacterium]|nr:hypothetical protein [Micromonosporaceae bacterium]
MTRRRPRTGMLVGAAAAVAVVFGLSASMATGVGPVAATGDDPAAAVAPVDPWTGDPLPVDAPDPSAAAGTDDAVTTPAGPGRAQAVAAAVRPVARNVPTGAAGAARVVAKPPVVRAPAPAPAPLREAAAEPPKPPESATSPGDTPAEDTPGDDTPDTPPVADPPAADPPADDPDPPADVPAENPPVAGDPAANEETPPADQNAVEQPAEGTPAPSAP